MFAQLGGAAASIASEVESLGGVVTVTDGAGRILTVQGDKETLASARDSNMAPWSCWSEWATGTNGMGTALEAPGPVLISGPEHWCAGFDEWICAGVAVRDARDARGRRGARRLDLARPPSARDRRVAFQGGGQRTRGSAPARPRQRRRAGRGVRPDARRASDRRSPPSTRAARSSSPTKSPASSSASPRACRRCDPAVRWQPGLDLRPLARHAIKQARRDHGWVGSTQIVTELGSEPRRITLRPVFLADQPIGTLALFGAESETRRARAAGAADGPAGSASWA